MAFQVFIDRIGKSNLPVFLVFAGLTVLMTWPLTVPGLGIVPDSDDTYFSIWRLAWIAHQLTVDPGRLFDANVFYPATGTLAYSDAILLLGIAAAPFFWIGVEPSVIHNGLIATAFVTSMCTAYLLALRLTHDRTASILAAIIFGFAPYRFGHIGHLELQWVMWMPLSLLLLHRLFDSPRRSTAIALGAAVAAQTLCSIYYGVFLSVYLAIAWLGLAINSSKKRRVAGTSLLAALPLLVVVGIYGPPYARSREAAGPRRAAEVSLFSARPGDFLRVAPENRLRGAPGAIAAPDERSLFPGAIAIALAITALWPPVSRTTWLYVFLAAFSIDASLGTNGFFFPAFQRLVPVVTSLRSPARFGILLVLSVSVLAAVAAARLNRAFGRRASVGIGLCTCLCLAEYFSAPVSIRKLESEPSAAHRWLATQPQETVVLEMPVPTLNSLWLYETTFQLRSIHHWKRLVNGYSAFVTREYARTLIAMESFPDEASVRRLRQLKVDLVLVNHDNYDDESYSRLISSLMASPDFENPRTFGGGSSEILAIELKK